MNEQLQAVFTLNDSAFARGTDRILAMLGRIEQRGERMGRQLQQNFESPLGSLTKLSAGLLTVDKAFDLLKQGIQVVSDFQRLNSALSSVSSSSIDYARTQSFLRSLSDSLGVSYEALAVSYKDLKAATNGTNLEGKETERIFTSVVRAGAALKLSNEQVKGALRAVTQMMSTGTVQADELKNELGNHLPGALAIMSRALGVTQGELMKMLETGQVMSSEALPKLATELEKTFGSKAQSNVNSIAGGWTRALDQLKLFISEFAQTKGIDTFFAKIGNGIANVIKDFRRVQNGGLQNEMDDFAALTPDKQKKRLSELGGKVNRAQAELNTISADAPTDKNLKREAYLEKRIAYMRQLYGQMYMAVKDGENRAADVAARAKSTASDPIAVFNKKKQRFDYLNDLKAALASTGDSLPKKEAAELAALTIQIDRATAATKRLKETAKQGGPFGDVASLKRLEAWLESGIQVAGGKGVDDKIRQLAAVREQIEKISALTSKDQRAEITGIKPIVIGKEETVKPIAPTALGVTLDPVTTRNTNAQVREIVENMFRLNQLVPGLSKKSGFTQTLNDLQKILPGIEYYQNTLQSIETEILNTSLRGLAVPKTTLDSLHEVNSALERANNELLKAKDPVAFVQQRISEIQRDLANLSFEGLEPNPETIRELSELLKQLRQTSRDKSVDEGKAYMDEVKNQKPNEKWNSVSGISENFKDSALASLAEHRDQVILNAKDMTDSLVGVLQQGAMAASEAMGGLIAGLIDGTMGIEELPQIVLGVMADMLKSLAATLASSGAFLLFVNPAMGAAQLAAAAGLYAASSLASAGAQPKKRKAMAKGGYLSGPTEILAGEYQSASQRGKGEWISPVDTGAVLIANNLMKLGVGGGGGGSERLVAEIAGDKLQLLLIRTAANKGRG